MSGVMVVCLLGPFMYFVYRTWRLIGLSYYNRLDGVRIYYRDSFNARIHYGGWTQEQVDAHDVKYKEEIELHRNIERR